MPRLKTAVISSADATKQIVLVLRVPPESLGSGDVDWVCGNCDTILVKGADRNTFASPSVFQCPTCQAYSVPKETH